MNAAPAVTGKRVIVTGASSGLGLAMAEALAAGGAKVVITGRDLARGEAAARIVRAKGEAWFVAHDAADAASWTPVLETAQARLGGIDGLINNVGVNAVKPIDETRYADFLRMAQINLYTTWHGVTLAAVRMTAGSIINVSSMAARYANPRVAPYCVAKSMVGGLSRAAAAEFAARRIRVNTIYPGMFMTDLTARLSFPDDAAREAQRLRIPMKRFGLPHELGPLACFLISDASIGITGADFVVDGGRTA